MASSNPTVTVRVLVMGCNLSDLWHNARLRLAKRISPELEALRAKLSADAERLRSELRAAETLAEDRRRLWMETERDAEELTKWVEHWKDVIDRRHVELARALHCSEDGTWSALVSQVRKMTEH